MPSPRSSAGRSRQKALQIRVKQYEDSVPLPGTLISEEDDVSFRTKRTASNSSSNQVCTAREKNSLYCSLPLASYPGCDKSCAEAWERG